MVPIESFEEHKNKLREFECIVNQTNDYLIKFFYNIYTLKWYELQYEKFIEKNSKTENMPKYLLAFRNKLNKDYLDFLDSLEDQDSLQTISYIIQYEETDCNFIYSTYKYNLYSALSLDSLVYKLIAVNTNFLEVNEKEFLKYFINVFEDLHTLSYNFKCEDEEYFKKLNFYLENIPIKLAAKVQELKVPVYEEFIGELLEIFKELSSIVELHYKVCRKFKESNDLQNVDNSELHSNWDKIIDKHNEIKYILQQLDNKYNKFVNDIKTDFNFEQIEILEKITKVPTTIEDFVALSHDLDFNKYYNSFNDDKDTSYTDELYKATQELKYAINSWTIKYDCLKNLTQYIDKQIPENNDAEFTLPDDLFENKNNIEEPYEEWLGSVKPKCCMPEKIVEVINYFATNRLIDNDLLTKQSLAFRLTGRKKPENLIEQIPWHGTYAPLFYFIKYYGMEAWGYYTKFATFLKPDDPKENDRKFSSLPEKAANRFKYYFYTVFPDVFEACKNSIKKK